MARRAVPESLVTDITRLLISQQRRLAQATPAATQLEPPPRERRAAFPTHDGAAAYVDGESAPSSNATVTGSISASSA